MSSVQTVGRPETHRTDVSGAPELRDVPGRWRAYDESAATPTEATIPCGGSHTATLRRRRSTRCSPTIPIRGSSTPTCARGRTRTRASAKRSASATEPPDKPPNRALTSRGASALLAAPDRSRRDAASTPDAVRGGMGVERHGSGSHLRHRRGPARRGSRRQGCGRFPVPRGPRRL